MKHFYENDHSNFSLYLTIIFVKGKVKTLKSHVDTAATIIVPSHEVTF